MMHTPPTPTPSAFTLDLRPPPGPEWIEVPKPWPQWVWLGGLALGLVLLLLLVRFLRPRPAMTPRQLFQQQLGIVGQRLKTMPTSALVHLGVYLRQFLRAEFALPALTQTEEELAATLRADERFSPEQQALLVAVLNDAASAKFAEGFFSEEKVQAHVDALSRWLAERPA